MIVLAGRCSVTDLQSTLSSYNIGWLQEKADLTGDALITGKVMVMKTWTGSRRYLVRYISIQYLEKYMHKYTACYILLTILSCLIKQYIMPSQIAC